MTMLQKQFGKVGEAENFGILLGDKCDIWQREVWFVLDSGLSAFGMYPVSAISTKKVLASSLLCSGMGCFVFFFPHPISQLFLPPCYLFPQHRFLESYLPTFLHKSFVGLCQLKKWRQPGSKISTKIQTATESSPGL